MPINPLATTELLVEEKLSIAIGFELSVADESMQKESNVFSHVELFKETEHFIPTLLDNTTVRTGPNEPLTGYEQVEDMMRRQDQVLMQLEELDARIELVIKNLSDARKSEIEALEPETDLDDRSTGLRKAG